MYRRSNYDRTEARRIAGFKVKDECRNAETMNEQLSLTSSLRRSSLIVSIVRLVADGFEDVNLALFEQTALPVNQQIIERGGHACE